MFVLVLFVVILDTFFLYNSYVDTLAIFNVYVYLEGTGLVEFLFPLLFSAGTRLDHQAVKQEFQYTSCSLRGHQYHKHIAGCNALKLLSYRYGQRIVDESNFVF